MRCLLVLGCLAALTGTARGQATLLVPETFPTIQGALDAAAGGDTVLVAPGTYVENLTVPAIPLLVRSRRGAERTTVASTISGPTVSFQAGAGRDTIFDGFTLTAGGPGMAIFNSSPTVRNCIIRNNFNWKFSGNGGGLHCRDGAPAIYNCVVRDNETDFDAAGMFFDGTTSGWVLVVNCVVYRNSSFLGDWYGAIGSENSQLLIVNTISRGNTDNTWDLGINPPSVIIHSNWSTGNGGHGSNGNINVDPQWLAPTSGNFHLRAGSPCRDAGTRLLPELPGLVGGLPEFDYDGDPRWVGLKPDMGIDEYTPHLSYKESVGSTVLLELFGVPPGQPCHGWLSTGRLDPPAPTIYGPFQLESRGITLFDGQPMPVTEKLTTLVSLPFAPTGVSEFYAQALGGQTLSNLEVVPLE